MDRARCSDRSGGRGVAGEGIENEFDYLEPLSENAGLNVPVYTQPRGLHVETLVVSISRSNRVNGWFSLPPSTGR